ncbi:MAG: TolC family protein [Deltaproteobacteria bacterium]|nr:TolC family protein [Deltaproteobacteria bacterium]
MKNILRLISTVAFMVCVFCLKPATGFALDPVTDTGPISEPALAIKNNRVEMPLKSVLLLGLKNNLNIQFASYTPGITETGIQLEEGKFDTLLSTQYQKNRSVTQTGNALGSTSSPVVKEERHNWEGKLQKKFLTGTQAELKTTNEEYLTDTSFQGLKPQFKNTIALSLTQPLLKDFGIGINETFIKIANLNYETSEYEFRDQVMNVMYQIEAFYWDLYYRNQDLLAKQDSLKQAEELQREFKIRIEAGALAPIEIHQADANVAQRKQEVIVAQAAVQAAEDYLKAALNLYDQKEYWDIEIFPSDLPNVINIKPSVDDCVKTAFENRPDLKQAQLGIRASELQLKYAKNQKLPNLSLFGSMGTSGIAGTPSSTAGVFGPFYQGTKSPYNGQWDKARSEMLSGDFYNYVIGVKFEVPIENNIAKSQYQKARLQSEQAVTNMKSVENIVINDVREALRRLDTSYKVIDSATANLTFTKEKLWAEQKKYEVGMSTARDVLDFQRDVAQAKSTLALAKSEHSKSIVNLSRVTGVLIEQKGLQYK